MLTRRRFLQANAAGLALPLVGAAQPAPARTAKSAVSPSDSTAARDYWNDWPRYLTSKVNEARARRKAALAAVRTPEQARERAERLRSKVWELIGGPLEKSPLNPQTVGTIQRTAYRIEKVIFESQPQVFVTAHLYLPAKGQGPFPAILSPLGHTRNGKAARSYQYVYQTLARKGYVVLAFDPFGQGERHQYLDPRTGSSRYGPTGEHSQAGRQMLLLGANFAQYRVWDGIRALDYLLSRPEVDSNRIGCTGQSGGATMTMYLCALEPRIHAAVEVDGNSENLAGPNYEPPGSVADAEQNLVGSLAVGLDRGDLLWAFAPKPLLLCYTPEDAGTTYSPVYREATEDIYAELQEVYGLLGAKEKVGLFASPMPHGFDFFNRRATYEWFNRWLTKDNPGSEEAEFDSAPEEELNCTSTGQVLTSLGGRSVVALNRDRARTLVPTGLLGGEAADAGAVRDRIREKLLGLLTLPSEHTPLNPRALSTNTRREMSIEEFDFQSEPGLRIPGWFLKPSGAGKRLPTVVYLSDGRKNDLVREPGAMDNVIRRGFAVCAIDARGLGISTPRFPSAGPLFYWQERQEEGYAWACLILGQPVLGQRVWDLIRCLDYLETRPEVDADSIRVLGESGGGIVALLGSVLDPRVKALMLRRVAADLRSVVESEEYTLQLSSFLFGILRDFDFPDLVTALAPRPCRLLNPQSPQGETVPESALRERYSSALKHYARLGAEGKLRFLVRPDQEFEDSVIAWATAA
jgi:cephalosporin-C deacetylase-like acetyl esterase